MFWYVIEIISSLWSTEQNKRDKEIEPIDEGWIALLSEIENRISQEQRETIANDLRLISQNRHNLRSFPRILEAVREVFLRYDSDMLQKLSLYPLTSDIKYCIFRDVLNQLSPKWLEEIVKFAPEASDNWYPEKYRQNILGEMISITSHTSPNQLTMIGLSQTIKAIHLSLIQSLNSYRSEPLSDENSLALLDLMMSSIIIEIVDLWIKTVTNCKNSLSKQGQITAKIKQAEQNKEEQIQRIKESGQIDAKYSTGENDEIRQSYLDGEQKHLIDRGKFDLLKSKLSAKISSDDI